MKTFFFGFTLFVLMALSLKAKEFYTLDFPPTKEITTAKVSFLKISYKPRAALVLCPGMNGDPYRMLRDSQWKQFSELNQIALVGIHFVSPPDVLFSDRGYTSPELGSGDILLNAIREEYGEDIPLILYGFSSGALFVKKFVILNESAVLTWAAHATGWYSEKAHLTPPGVISCGSLDALRLAPSLTHFKLTRSKQSPTLWVELGEVGHEQPAKLIEFICSYFQCVLIPKGKPTWVDITNLNEISTTQAVAQPTLSGWLPDHSLISNWRSLWGN